MLNLICKSAPNVFVKAHFEFFFSGVAFCIIGICHHQQAKAQQLNVYPPITAVKNGLTNSLSPDPIINYTWANPKASDGMESYQLHPVSWSASDTHSFDMADFKKSSAIIVTGEGDLRFDFGQENAGWLEFDSPDLSAKVEMNISEYNQPPVYTSNYPPKTLSPQKYGNTPA